MPLHCHRLQAPVTPAAARITGRITRRIARRSTGLIAPLLAVLLAAGGSRAGAAPDAAPALGRPVPVAAAPAVSLHEAARQLLDHGEAAFPTFFPGHARSQLSAPFVYRHYPPTGTYLGVVVQDEPGYRLGDVFVMGGPFGAQPVAVGPLAAFITPAERGSGPSARSNGCHDRLLERADVPGARHVIVYQGDGLPGGFMTVDTRVIGPASFEGQSVVESLLLVGPGAAIDGLAPGEGVTQTRLFLRRTGPAELSQHGLVSNLTASSTIGGLETTTAYSGTQTFTPPLPELPHSVALGDSATVSTTTHLRTSVVTSSPPLPPSQQSQSSDSDDSFTVRFLRRETLSVPAGRFDACVFEATTTASAAVVTTWVADGQGFTLRTLTVDGERSTTLQAWAIQLDGVAVTR